MTPWIEQIIVALKAARLEAIFVREGAAAFTGSTTASIELLVRDTPIHRQRVHLVAQRLACARVPLSEQARAIKLLGGPLPIDVVFGQLGAESYGAVRARAARVGDARGILAAVTARIHPTVVIDEGAQIGIGSRIWHFAHVMGGAVIGERCVIGQGCFIGNVRIGNGCKVQNHVSIYDGVTLEDDVFIGPSCVFTNVLHPRAHVERKTEFAPTVVRKGASIGANATILAGVTIGSYALIGAGSVITRDVDAHAIVVGNPMRQIGLACICGETLPASRLCARCGLRPIVMLDPSP